MSDSVTRTVSIAVIAGVLFAGFLALTPRLTAGSQTTDPADLPSAVTTVPGVVDRAISDPVVPVPEAAVTDGAGQDPVSAVPDEGVAGSGWNDGPEPDGTLTLSVELLGPIGGKETVILEDGGTAQWHFRARNTSSAGLWGVYVYLEGYGHVECDDTYLTPGGTTDCQATDQVWSGNQTAVAWATAWTSELQVADVISYEYYVGE